MRTLLHEGAGMRRMDKPDLDLSGLVRLWVNTYALGRGIVDIIVDPAGATDARAATRARTCDNLQMSRIKGARAVQIAAPDRGGAAVQLVFRAVCNTVFKTVCNIVSKARRTAMLLQSVRNRRRRARPVPGGVIESSGC
jgi:hypothetical protein